MLFRVDPASSASLADQIAVQVRTSIEHGTLVAGERLPPARDLARSLNINMHTVLRAYQMLRDDEIIEMRQGRGAWVRTDAAPGLIRVNELARQLVDEARKVGLSRTDVVRLIERTHTE
ncbi:MAG: GntR family transcriptional regulator [Rhodoglobus sp.]